RKIYVRGEGARVVVLLHEINGLSPGCIDFGNKLAAQFKVYMPLLFGHAPQDSLFWGALESCGFGGFHCLAVGGKRDTHPVRWVADFVKHLELRKEVRSIGIVGMCQTGAFPLAAMKKDSKVKAVVLSQPAIPFGKDKQNDVGIAPTSMEQAKASGIPI